jgi:hypothetical protein
MKNRQVVAVGLASLVAVAIGSAYLVGRARASGVPATQPLTFSGVLTDTTGAPLTGSKNLQVQVWDDAAAGNVVCTSGSTAQTLVGGSFSIGLPTTCTTAVHASPDLWAELLVDGASVGRTKLGAVPYALEADTASNAAGALAQALAKIPTIQVNTSGYVACQPITNFSTAGWSNLLIRASIYSDAACTVSTNDPQTCHPWCAGDSVRDPVHFAANCCGVGVYYTTGIVDVLQYK